MLYFHDERYSDFQTVWSGTALRIHLTDCKVLAYHVAGHWVDLKYHCRGRSKYLGVYANIGDYGFDTSESSRIIEGADAYSEYPPFHFPMSRSMKRVLNVVSRLTITLQHLYFKN